MPPAARNSGIIHPPLNASTILSWAQHLRDDKIFSDVQALLLVRPEFAHSVQEFLYRLDRTNVTRPLLQQTRIHFALKEISSKRSGWSPRIKSQAEATLQGWQALFGDLNEISPDPWAEGNQLAGIHRLKTRFGRTKTLNGTIKDTWIVKSAPHAQQALGWGHNGFSVGEWWINAAAAFRDGIILAFDGVTAGPSGATAIVMRLYQEMHPTSESRMKYQPSPKDPRSARILRNFTDKKPVRVLRSRGLLSPFAPQVGLRYDGLYRVTGYSLDLDPKDPNRESLLYTFDMEREQDQPSLRQALEHPNADERDLWDQYARTKHLHDIEPSAVDRKEPGLAIVWGSGRGELISGRRDSGFWTE